MMINLGVINYKGELMFLIQVLSENKVLKHLAHGINLGQLNTCAIRSDFELIWVLWIELWESC